MLLVEDRITCPHEADCSGPPPVNEREQPHGGRPTLDGIVHDPLLLVNWMQTVAGIDQWSEAFGIGSIGVNLSHGRG